MEVSSAARGGPGLRQKALSERGSLRFHAIMATNADLSTERGHLGRKVGPRETRLPHRQTHRRFQLLYDTLGEPVNTNQRISSTMMLFAYGIQNPCPKTASDKAETQVHQ